MLTNGIKTGEYDAAVLSINANTAGARNNLEKAQLRLLEYKSLIDEHKRNKRNVFSVEGRGQGSGGRGRSRGGPGRGEAGVMAYPQAVLTPPIAPNMSTQLAVRPRTPPSFPMETGILSRSHGEHMITWPRSRCISTGHVTRPIPMVK